MSDSTKDRYPRVRLADIADVVRGSSPRPAGDPQYFNGTFLPWITVADLTRDQNPYLTSTISCLTKEGARRTRIFDPGTVLLTNSGATLGIPKITGIRGGANDGIAGFLNLSRDVCPQFLYYSLLSLTDYLRTKVASGVGQPNLNTELIGEVHISLPPLPQQQAIAALLAVWDRAIQLLDKLIDAELRFKRGMMQQLLTGKRRFPEYLSTEFVQRRIGDLMTEVSRSVEWDDNALYHLASVRRHSGGLFWRESLNGHQIKVKKLNDLRRGDFLISHIQAAYGAMGIVPSEFEGAKVSDMYSVFVPRDPNRIDVRYFDYLSQLPWMRYQAYLACNGFFAERLRLNFDPAEFLRQEVTIPEEIAEQRKIVVALSTLDTQIKILRKQLLALKEQKKGLMKKLLTGTIRVKAEP